MWLMFWSVPLFPSHLCVSMLWNFNKNFFPSGPYFINSQYPLLLSHRKQMWGSPCLCLFLYFCVISMSSPSGLTKKCHTFSFFQLIRCLPPCFALYTLLILLSIMSLEESVFFSKYLACFFFHQWQLSLCSAPLKFNDKQWPLHADTLFLKLFSSFFIWENHWGLRLWCSDGKTR